MALILAAPEKAVNLYGLDYSQRATVGVVEARGIAKKRTLRK